MGKLATAVFVLAGVLNAFLLIPQSSAQPAGYRQICIIIHGGNTSKNMSVVPSKFTVGECALLAAGYEQRPPGMGGTTYELGCMTDSGALLATTPVPFSGGADPNATAWSGPNPGRPPVEYSTCATLWGGH